MAENILGLVLLLIYRSSNLEYSKISPKKRVYRVNVTKRCHSKFNKSRPQLVAALQQG